MTYIVSERGKFVNSSGIPLMDRDVPCLRWGDALSISFKLPEGCVASDDTFALAVDTDRFLGNGLCALAENATIDTANRVVSFTAIPTNTQKLLNAVNGKAGCVTGQMQLTRYIGGNIASRQTLLDDRCMLKGLVYVNGATVYILDPNAAYTKEQVDAIFETAVEFQFSTDGEAWHDEQDDSDIYLRFRNPAVETAAWSEAIRFMRSDIVPLVERAENAAIEAGRQAGLADDARAAANAAKIAAFDAKNSAGIFSQAANQSAVNAAESAETARLAKNGATDAKTLAVNAKNTAVQKADEASQYAIEASGYRSEAQTAASTAGGKAIDAASSANAARADRQYIDGKVIEVQQIKQDAIEDCERIAASAGQSATSAASDAQRAETAAASIGDAVERSEAAATSAEASATSASASAASAASASAKIPDIASGDAGKVLKVKADESGAEWGALDILHIPISEIPASATTATLADGAWAHTPTDTPTYTLPNVTDASVTHQIVVRVTFSSSVLTCNFQDADGNAVAWDSTPTITDGMTVDFLAEYVAGAWRVYPCPMAGGAA